MSKKNGLNILALAGCLLFLVAAIYYDNFDTPTHPLDGNFYYFLPLTIMVTLTYIYLWYEATNINLKSCWWFFLSLSTNWNCRYIFSNRLEHIPSEYIFLAIAVVGIFYQRHKYKQKIKLGS